MSSSSKNSRIITLDLLRGYFIFVIIVDHLLRWPSILAWGTGQGRLWVTAAEGFFIISGLLVGYTRGYKKRSMPLKELTILLYRRAALLYISGLIATIILVVIAVRSTFPDALLPMLPASGQSTTSYLWQLMSQQYVFEWVYFLKLYWIMLLISPVFIWLLRKKKLLLYTLLTFSLWLAGVFLDYQWLQWQVLFFVPAMLGYYLEPVRRTWQEFGVKKQNRVRFAVIGSAIITIILSVFFVFGWPLVEKSDPIMSFDSYVSIRAVVDPIFSIAPLSIARTLLSFLWFSALFLFVRRYEPKFKKLLGWLLIPFGERSLSAYILHAFVLIFVQSLVMVSENEIYNTAVSVGVVLLIWLILKIPLVKKILPR